MVFHILKTHDCSLLIFKARTEGAWLAVVFRFLLGYHLLVWRVRLACLMTCGDADMSINSSKMFLFFSLYSITYSTKGQEKGPLLRDKPAAIFTTTTTTGWFPVSGELSLAVDLSRVTESASWNAEL